MYSKVQIAFNYKSSIKNTAQNCVVSSKTWKNIRARWKHCSLVKSLVTAV